MADIKWIKLSTDVFNNRKVKIIEKMPDGDSLIVIWIKLLCLAGTVNDSGLVYLTKDVPYTDEMLSVAFDRPLQTVRLALSTFERFGMIEIINDILMLPSWEKYQSVDALEKFREQARLRKQRQRTAQKAIICHVTCHDDVTQCHATEEELDKDKEILSVESEKKVRFVPPTVDEVAEYCNKRKNGIDPEHFVSHYEARGWKYNGNLCMKSWKAAVVTWEKRNPKRESGGEYDDAI